METEGYIIVNPNGMYRSAITMILSGGLILESDDILLAAMYEEKEDAISDAARGNGVVHKVKIINMGPIVLQSTSPED